MHVSLALIVTLVEVCLLFGYVFKHFKVSLCSPFIPVGSPHGLKILSLRSFIADTGILRWCAVKVKGFQGWWILLPLPAVIPCSLAHSYFRKGESFIPVICNRTQYFLLIYFYRSCFFKFVNQYKGKEIIKVNASWSYLETATLFLVMKRISRFISMVHEASYDSINIKSISWINSPCPRGTYDLLNPDESCPFIF